MACINHIPIAFVMLMGEISSWFGFFFNLKKKENELDFF